MPARDKTTLKGFFNAGDVPTEDNYADLIDSFKDIGEPNGDMVKSIYDTNNDGSVDNADDSNKLDGLESSATAEADAHIVKTDSSGYIYALRLTSTKGIYIAGTSFPTSPVTGQIFFRSDLGLLCYYDGVRWLTVNEYEGQTEHFERSANGTYTFGNVRTDYAHYYTRITVKTGVLTPNDGSNYWTILVRTVNASYSANTQIYSFNTLADGLNVTNHEGNPSTNIPTNYGFCEFNYTKTGSPGNLWISGTLYFRLIIT